MFPDHSLVLDNSGPEVWVTSGIVTSYVQIEPVEIGQGRDRKDTPSERQDWKEEENRVETPPPLLFKMFRHVRG